MKCRLLSILSLVALFISCSPSRQIARSARVNVLKDSSLRTAHLGISIYEPATGKYWFNYQGDKYFVPASNTKIPTCYAAMKYLGDSLVGLRYLINDTTISVLPSGDPSFLHSDFANQHSFHFLKRFKRIDILTDWQEDALGSGWSWNDFNETYMAERSAFPMYGNLARFSVLNDRIITVPKVTIEVNEEFESGLEFNKTSNKISSDKFSIQRKIGDNVFLLKKSNIKFSITAIPLRIIPKVFLEALKDTLQIRNIFQFATDKADFNKYQVIHSQPTDSLLKPMMHRSDNFFAEQSLLMVSNEFLGFMNDAKIIDTLLKTDFKDLPQKPRWVDGSGLSRYNLFTPKDFVFILNKMKNDFGMDRIKKILPTGREGTLSNYYVNENGYIYAKTGTLSDVVALSGFLYTKKNRLLIFSVLVNNHNSSATQVRRAVEKFVKNIREKY